MNEARERSPGDLAESPPGPALAAALDAIDLSQLNGHDLVALAPAYLRLISHLQARLLDLLAQVQHSPPGGADAPVARTPHPQRWAEVEIAARLRWTAAKAGYELRYAHHLTRRLPAVYAALVAGDLDMSQARAIVDGLAGLPDEAARALGDQVLAAGAAQWHTRQLADRVRWAAIAYDPGVAARRHRRQLAKRRVQVEPHPDGTAHLVALDLPPERVVSAVERLTAIARSAKGAGDRRSLDQLRADSFLDLLTGVGIGATPPAAVTNPAPDPSRAPTTPEVGTSAGPGTGPGEHAPGGGHGSSRPGRSATTAAASDTAGSSSTAAWSITAGSSGSAGSSVGGSSAAALMPGGRAALPGPRRGVVEVQASLSTLIGLAEAPGELAGWGPVVADVVRQVAAQQQDAQWRFSVYDDLGDGRLVHHGVTRARPISPTGRGEPAARGAPATRGALTVGSEPSVRDVPAAGGAGRPAAGKGHRDPPRSHPSASDVAFVRARDRTCRGPHGCRAPASRCDIDHTVARADGGGHGRDNLGPLCRREHRFKHESGATLRQTAQGVFEWITPLGHSYPVTPEAYDEATGPPTERDRPRRRLARVVG